MGEPFPGKPLGNGLYEVDLNEMDDLHIFQARAPGFRPEDGVRVEPEPIGLDTPLGPLDLILFYDKKSRIPMEDGVNQQGYVVDDEQALYLRGRVRSIKLTELRKQGVALVVRGIHPALAPYVAQTLLRFRRNPIWFGFATNFLMCQNFAPFLTGEFFPPDPTYNDGAEYESAWQHFVSQIQPYDFILTFDRRSFLSKLIAKVTHGPFSHIAHYMGDGNIWEVVTSGTRIAPLEIYKGRHYRVAAYRHTPGLLKSAEEADAQFKATAGRQGYNYFGAIQAGIRTFFGDRHYTTTTPNGIILSGPLTFISQV
jgi:hypothetical protein